MGQPMAVTLTPQGKAAGGILEAATPLPSGWERGVAFMAVGCVAPWTVGECPDDPGLKPTARPGSGRFSPYFVGAGVECTSRSRLDVATLSAEALDGSQDFALGQELATAAASIRDAAIPNPSLTTSVTNDLGAKTSLAESVACLDGALATSMFGRSGVIHLSPSSASLALSERVIWRDGRVWRTAWGSQVVVSAGYEGVVDGVSGAQLAWATGPLHASVGQRATLLSIDRDINDDEARTEDIALVAFDPCFVAQVDTGVIC